MPALLLLSGLAVVLAACGGHVPGRSSVPVVFRAPSEPDPEIMPLLQEVATIGVLSSTNIQPMQSVDIERVMGRLSDATARSLGHLPDRRIVTQDEIRWHFKDITLDSAHVFSDSVLEAMQEELEIDALVYVALRNLESQMTPVAPGPHGNAARTPGVNLTIELELTLLNLRTGDRWTQTGKRSSWEPVQANVVGGGDRTEQQLVSALAGPMREFLERVSPPPSRRQRQFDISGD